MSKLEKLLSQYAAYHLDHKNIVTHFVGIPLIVLNRKSWHDYWQF